MADSIPTTPTPGGGIPTLLDHLQEQFKEYLGDSVSEEDSLAEFFTFAEKYLAENRPVETAPADQNVVLKLSNSVSVTVSPPTGTESKGEMQQSASTRIT